MPSSPINFCDFTDIEEIRRLVEAGQFGIRLHVAQHALQEGFSERDIVASILNGRIVERYPARNRVLICGKFPQDVFLMYLHTVCELDRTRQVVIVTAYIPSTKEWEDLPYRRKSR